MRKSSSIVFGAGLILLGMLSIGFAVIMSWLGWSLAGFILSFWPLIVVAAGLAFVVPPFLRRDKPGLSGLFFPGMPILMTGMILLVASVFNAWGIWAWLWPMEVLAVAAAFVLAALFMKKPWLLFPAIIIGLNGIVFQFSAITGLWEWWSVLWTIEPLALGLAFLVLGAHKRKRGLTITGLVFLGLAGFFFLLMVTILGGWWPIRLVGGGMLVLAGVVMLALGLFRNQLLPRSALE